MGRPRKRRIVEEAQEPVTQEASISYQLVPTHLPQPTQPQPSPQLLPQLQPQPPPAQTDIYDIQIQPDVQNTLYFDPVDTDFSFLDETTSAGLEFWDLLPDNHQSPVPASVPAEPRILLQDGIDPSLSNSPRSTANIILGGVDLLGAIDFDVPDQSEESVSKDINQSLQHLADHFKSRQMSKEKGMTPPDSVFGSDHGTSVASPEDGATTPPPPTVRSVPSVNCGCLSSLYLAIDSLSRLPDDVVSAMRVARHASKVAHDAVRCRSCLCANEDDVNSHPPIQSFQTLMLLATLIPSACNAYAAILEMVDAETTAAKKEKRTFRFVFKDLGGLWGYVGRCGKGCAILQSYNNSDMTPDMWRATIRALLRLDVYGMDAPDGLTKKDNYVQLGLKDVVTLLEERSHKRHQAIDSLVASGQLPSTSVPGVLWPKKQPAPEDRHCLRVLETARIALDNLVIA